MIPFTNTFAQLPEQFHSKQQPAQIVAPAFIKVNCDLATQLGIDPEWLESEKGLAILSGNSIADGSEPLAQVYAGHQFGGWSPQLGDGRALLLGEVIDTDGCRKDIQLKGSGRTLFSRGGDGKSALGPVLREFLMSEAFYAMGIPTTRALAAVTTGEKVIRETPLDGAILTRVASSHLRVGTFQYFASQQDIESVQLLLNYAIERHYPEIATSTTPALAFLEQVMARQAKLVSQWMAIGFIHGVMNTDNFSISGETIDFGPCAMMDEFHPQCVFSSIDRDSRYSWGNQPSIAHWNLSRLAETLMPLIDKNKEQAELKVKAVLDQFSGQFVNHYQHAFCTKLGIPTSTSGSADFIRETLTLLANQRIDFTLFFSHLTDIAKTQQNSPLLDLFENKASAEQWLEQWKKLHSSDLLDQMQRANPVFIPRNHLIEKAIQLAYKNDFSLFHRLHQVWKTPYLDNQENADLKSAPTADEKVWHTFCGT